MPIALGFGVGQQFSQRKPGAPFAPSSLFASDEAGTWYDPSDLSTLYQDSAGTTAVTADGDPVGRIEDKSGNDNHATQSTDAARPVYRTDGTLHWLDFDGVDDFLEFASFTITGSRGVAAIVAVNAVSTGNDRFISGNSANADFQGGGYTLNNQEYLVDSNGVTLASPASDGTTVVARAETQDLTHAYYIDGTKQKEKSTSAFSITPNGFVVGKRIGSSEYTECKLFGIVFIDRSLSDAEAENVESHLAGKSGVVL